MITAQLTDGLEVFETRDFWTDDDFARAQESAFQSTDGNVAWKVTDEYRPIISCEPYISVWDSGDEYDLVVLGNSTDYVSKSQANALAIARGYMAFHICNVCRALDYQAVFRRVCPNIPEASDPAWALAVAAGIWQKCVKFSSYLPKGGAK